MMLVCTNVPNGVLVWLVYHPTLARPRFGLGALIAMLCGKDINLSDRL